MNITETAQFHAMAMAIDGRIKPLDDQGIMASAWQAVLEDVPFREARYILKALYREPQMLVLQPGHAAKVWEELKAEREKALRDLVSVDWFLKNQIGFEESMYEMKRNQRERLWASLPPHVQREYEATPLELTQYRNATDQYDRKLRDGDLQPWDHDPRFDEKYAKARETFAAGNFGALPA